MKHIPQFVVHGDADHTVSVTGSRVMVAEMKKLGIDVTYIEVPGGTHLDVVMPNLPKVFDFLATKRAARPSATRLRETHDLRFFVRLPRPRHEHCAAGRSGRVLSPAWSAQGRRGGRFGGSVPLATPESFDGAFHFCRLAFRGSRGGDGGGWMVDFPRADVNLSIRLSELTKTHVSFDEAHEPRHLVVRPPIPELFMCPFVMATEVGAAYFDEDESARLRDYLLKGGFLWADDFWGSYAWEYWKAQIERILPPSQYRIVDLPLVAPAVPRAVRDDEHPADSLDQLLGRRGGGTSERGSDSAIPHARAILDRRERIMLLMTHNTDIGDSWEREGDDPDYFYTFSVNGYAFGVNTLIYAMTH